LAISQRQYISTRLPEVIVKLIVKKMPKGGASALYPYTRIEVFKIMKPSDAKILARSWTLI
jgi:hypothetical protein